MIILLRYLPKRPFNGGNSHRRGKMFLRTRYLTLFLCFCVSNELPLDCDDPSVVIECLYDVDSGESCGLRLEQSFRLFDVVNSEVIKIHEWLDEEISREELRAVDKLRSHLREIVGPDNASYGSTAYVLYICRFRPFSCTRATRYRRGSHMNRTMDTFISDVRSVRELMRTRWSQICRRMVRLEEQWQPVHVFWRDEGTRTSHCTFQSRVPWRYTIEISAQGFEPLVGITTYEKNMTVCHASVDMNILEEVSALRCTVRFRTGGIRTLYLRECGRSADDCTDSRYMFKTFIVLCTVAYLMMLLYANARSFSVPKKMISRPVSS